MITTILGTTLSFLMVLTGGAAGNASPLTETIEKIYERISPRTMDIESLDIEWDGSLIEMGAIAAPAPPPPPPPEPEPEPEPTPVPIEASRSEAREAAAPVYNEAESQGLYSLSQLMFNGVINWNGYKYTYYSQSVLPGPGLNIPGRHVNGGGYVADGNGYIVLAAPYGVAHGTVFPTPFGYSGKVYDTCASCSTSPIWLDIYTK